jgi:hypothetical protein
MAEIDLVLGSRVVSQLKGEHPDVEVWPDEDFDEGGYAYFWVVYKFAEGSVRNLAYLRVASGHIEKRTYDKAGDDLWIEVE